MARAIAACLRAEAAPSSSTGTGLAAGDGSGPAAGGGVGAGGSRFSTEAGGWCADRRDALKMRAIAASTATSAMTSTATDLPPDADPGKIPPRSWRTSAICFAP
jgi:hypothetical protein